MKFPVKTTAVIVVLGIGGFVAYPHARAWWKARNKPNYRQAAVTRGDIAAAVNATGTVQPVVRLPVGAFVSGPIVELYAYHTDKVEPNQLLAEIDPTIYAANVKRDEAARDTRIAERNRYRVLCEQAKRDRDRAILLRKDSQGKEYTYLSDTEMDQFEYNYLALEAQLAVAEAAVKQAEANLVYSSSQLGYTKIKAPAEGGTVIDCKIERGQTLTAQFQTPELFVIAPRMDEEMHVFARVDEADIGMIREAKNQDRPVQFTVDAYPDDLFEGKIHEVRYNPTTFQNVVTFEVVVKAPNPGEKLLPGMTANLSFETEKKKGVLKIPNAALRFYPKPEQVRPEDKELLEGAEAEAGADEESNLMEGQRSATERALANRKRNRRHVWIEEGEYLRAVAVVTGVSDYKWTELVSGKLKKGQKLVTGVGPPRS